MCDVMPAPRRCFIFTPAFAKTARFHVVSRFLLCFLQSFHGASVNGDNAFWRQRFLISIKWSLSATVGPRRSLSLCARNRRRQFCFRALEFFCRLGFVGCLILILLSCEIQDACCNTRALLVDVRFECRSHCRARTRRSRNCKAPASGTHDNSRA